MAIAQPNPLTNTIETGSAYDVLAFSQAHAEDAHPRIEAVVFNTDVEDISLHFRNALQQKRNENLDVHKDCIQCGEIYFEAAGEYLVYTNGNIKDDNPAYPFKKGLFNFALLSFLALTPGDKPSSSKDLEDRLMANIPQKINESNGFGIFNRLHNGEYVVLLNGVNGFDPRGSEAIIIQYNPTFDAYRIGAETIHKHGSNRIIHFCSVLKTPEVSHVRLESVNTTHDQFFRYMGKEPAKPVMQDGRSTIEWASRYFNNLN